MLDGAIEGAWMSRCCAWLLRWAAMLIVRIDKPTGAFLSRIGIEDVRRREIGVQPRIVPVGRPCPERSPGGPAETPTPSPTESPTPTAATPTPSPVPTGPAPTPAAAPSEAINEIAAPCEVAGDHTSTVEGRGFGCASNLGARCGKGVPLSVGYRRVIRRGGRPCCHGGSAGPGRSTTRSATDRPSVAGCELMPSGSCVAATVTFPRPRASGICTTWGAGINGRPRGRSPTAERRRAAVKAAAITTAAAEAARGAATAETTTSTSVGATTSTAAVTTAMLSEGRRGDADKTEGDDSCKKGLERGGLFHIGTFHRDFR